MKSRSLKHLHGLEGGIPEMRRDEEQHSISGGIPDSRHSEWQRGTSEEAYAEAVRRIRAAKAGGRKWLDLGDLPIKEVPSEIGILRHQLCTISLGSRPIGQDGQMLTSRHKYNRSCKVSDLTALARMNRLISVSLDGCMQVRDLSPLAGLPNLAELSLSECKQVSDLSPLAGLPNLAALSLRGCEQVSDLSPLSGLTNLAKLFLPWCEQVSDLRPLAGLTNLAELSLRGCEQVSDLRPLSGLTNLADLSLAECKRVSDLSPLAGLTNLAELKSSSCKQVSDLSPLAGLANLAALDLSECNQVSDLRPLAGLTNLAALSLRGCEQVSDLRPLSGLTNLADLSLAECKRVSDLSPLAGLTNLAGLWLIGCEQISDLCPLAGLANLVLLSLERCSQLSDLSPLAGLTNLADLSLDGCKQVSEVSPLSGLTNLAQLGLFSCEQVSDLSPLSGLTNLAQLSLEKCNQVSDLSPLSGLTNLAKLFLPWCEQVSDLSPLAGLTNLAGLWLDGCEQVSDLRPLSGLTNLAELSLRGCEQVSELSPLAGLTNLAGLWLDGCEQVSDLRPLAGLTNLADLSLAECKRVSDLSPLAGLTNLAELSLYGCVQVTDLSPLSGLASLTSLHLGYCKAQSFEPIKTLLPRLETLVLFRGRFADLHSSVTSSAPYENCIESVVHYYRALDGSLRPDSEFKVFVIGNGRAGKTYLVHRLMNESFESLKSRNIPSTHGVSILPYQTPVSWELPYPVQLIFWDFGGQDIYHGTHALFLREPALYLLLYTDQTENDDIVKEGGFLMRNRRLPYWFDYLQQEAGSGGVVASPVLLLRGRSDELLDPFTVPEPTTRPGPDRFPHLSPATPVSARDPDGLSFLRPRLRTALKTLLQQHPQPPLPTSWAGVRQAIRDMQVRKTPKTLAPADFLALCSQLGCEKDADVLRKALHQMGVVFYREGIFDGHLIIDQSWVLDKVYTIFNRHNPGFHREIRDKHGRFRLNDLRRFLWLDSTDSVADQRLYLAFMVQCGICFRADESRAADDEALYIAPDLLPAWGDGPQEEYQGWPHKPDAGVTANYVALHDGIARGFLASIGRRAGARADWWRFGCYFRDRTTGSEILIRTAGNAIRLEARGGAAAEVLDTLLDILRQVPSGQPPACIWDAHCHPPRATKDAAEGNPADRLDPDQRPAQKVGLARLGVAVFDRRVELLTFYLIGCAFHDGCPSLRAVQEKFNRPERRRRLPKDLRGTHLTALTDTIRDLRDAVFVKYFNKEGLKLLSSRGKGWPAVLSPDGERAWEATRDFLNEYCGGLPEW